MVLVFTVQLMLNPPQYFRESLVCCWQRSTAYSEIQYSAGLRHPLHQQLWLIAVILAAVLVTISQNETMEWTKTLAVFVLLRMDKH